MIVGITGHSGAGKDTVADYLVEKYGFVKVALADPLKRICKEVYDFSDLQLWGPSEERNKPDLRYGTGKGFLVPRVALQSLGTEWGRAIYDDTWVDYALRVADAILDKGMSYSQKNGLYKPEGWGRLFNKKVTGVVIPDVRFKNEMRHIRIRRRGFLARISRPGFEGNVGIANHASETEQKSIHDSEFDFILSNVSSLDVLKENVDKMVKRFKTGRRLRMIRNFE